jgi:hypothetical protein
MTHRGFRVLAGPGRRPRLAMKFKQGSISGGSESLDTSIPDI